MKNYHDLRKRKSGIILLSVIIILLSVGLIGATLAAFFISVNISSQTIVNEIKALYLAEAGISYAIKMLRTQAKESEIEEVIGPVSLGEGTFTVKINYAYSLITATGTVSGIDKKIQLQFTPL